MFSPVNEWLTIAFANPHKITIMWVMLKIVIYNLLWLAEYQCKGMLKFSLSDLFFCGQFWRSWKRLNWKNLLLTLIAVTRIINLNRRILKFKCFKCPIFIFYFRSALFFKNQVIINFFSLNFTRIEIEGKRVSSSQGKRTSGGEGGARRRAGENNRGGGGQNSGILSERPFKCPLITSGSS